MSSKIFLSYRREDSAGQAGRLNDRLTGEFGDGSVFMDVDGIPLGADFVERLTEEVASCDVLLAVIGPRWIDLRDENNKRRVDDPHDSVRVEIRAALQHNIPIIPIFLDGTETPRVDLLPHDIKGLTVRNGLDLRHASFHVDLNRLVRELKQDFSIIRPKQNAAAEQSVQMIETHQHIGASVLLALAERISAALRTGGEKLEKLTYAARLLRNWSLGRSRPRPEIRKIVGRENEIASLTALLDGGNRFIALIGIGGVGKSTIAELIYENVSGAKSTLSGRVWVSAKRLGLTHLSILEEFAVQLGHPSLVSSNSQVMERALIRHITNIGGVVFIVLDNFETLETTEGNAFLSFTRRLPENVSVITTSRPTRHNLLIAAQHFHIFEVSGLSADAATQYLDADINRLTRTQSKRPQLAEFKTLIIRTHGNPLALSIIVYQVCVLRRTIGSIENEVESGTADYFGELFSFTWNSLTASERLLSGICGMIPASFDRIAIETIALKASGAPVAGFTSLPLTGLIASISKHQGPEPRFEMHPLCVNFVMSRWPELPHSMNDARRAAVQFFIDRCSTERRFFWEGRRSYAEIDTYRSSIFDSIHWCQENRWTSEECALVTAIADFLYVKGYWNLAVSAGLHASAAATANGMPAEASWILVHLVGYVSANRGDVSRAINAFETARGLSLAAGDKVGQSDALRHLARAYRKDGRLDQARETYSLAYAYLEGSDLKLQRALTINELGKLERDSENFNEALAHFNAAIDELQEIDSSVGAGIKCNISGVALSLGDLVSAEIHARRALQHFEAVDNIEGMASCLDRLGRIAHRRDDYVNSEAYTQRAVALYLKLGMEAEANKLSEISVPAALVK